MGHWSNECPKEPQDLDDDGVSMMTFCKPANESFYGYEIVLDNGSQVNIVHPRFLTNIKREEGSYKGVEKTQESTRSNQSGYLDGFFRCIASNKIIINVLLQDDVESLYKVSYNQCKNITVHMEDRDLVFYKKNTSYVANMIGWGTDHEFETSRKPLSLATIKYENLTSKETRRAISAK